MSKIRYRRNLQSTKSYFRTLANLIWVIMPAL